MNYKVLARKWRPRNFREVVGQSHVVQALSNALTHNRLHHAYLFTGTRGVGKTTLARILAKAINCQNLQNENPCGQCSVCVSVDEGRFLDLVEIDAASHTGVDNIRDLINNAQYTPSQGQYKVYLIDEVHMLSGSSFNALLKTLEEPPLHVKFLLATTDPQKIPVTVLSRCLQFNLKQLLPQQIFSQMVFILQQEGINYEEAAIKLLARAADGSMRDGLSLLDQAIVYGNGQITSDDMRMMLGTVAQQPIGELLIALANQNAAAILTHIAAMADLTPDFADVLQQILQILHRAALVQQFPNFSDTEFDNETLAYLIQHLTPEDIQLYYQIALLAQKDLALAPDPRSGFEMVMLRMLAFRPISDQNQVSTPLRKPATLEPAPIDIAPNKAYAPTVAVPAAVIEEAPIQTMAMPPATPVVEVRPITSDHLDWTQMVAAMRLTGMTKELASHCVLHSLDDTSCLLLLDPASANIRSIKTQETLQAALQAYHGKPLKLTITTQQAMQDTPASSAAKAQEIRQKQAGDAILADKNIQYLQQHFGAQIIPGSIAAINNPVEKM